MLLLRDRDRALNDFRRHDDRDGWRFLRDRDDFDRGTPIGRLVPEPEDVPKYGQPDEVEHDGNDETESGPPSPVGRIVVFNDDTGIVHTSLRDIVPQLAASLHR
jgi:hypothetical protein